MSDSPYYSPESLGLTIVASLEADIAYEFNMAVVWRDGDGRLYWGTDSGCSCPSPFEGVNTVEDLNRLTSETWGQFQEAVEGMFYEPSDSQKADQTQFLAKVSPMVPIAPMTDG